MTIYSDHNPLMYLKECAPKRKSAKLTRWAFGLQEFDIVWSYRPGSRNQAADCFVQARVGGQLTASVWARVAYPGRIYCDSYCITIYLFRVFSILSH